MVVDLGSENALQPQEEKTYNDWCDKIVKPNMVCVEVGSWKGLTAAILAKRLRANNGVLYVIDPWTGISGTYDYARMNDVYQMFKANMVELNLWDCIHPMVMKSSDAVKIFKDGILDYVFVDGDHMSGAVFFDVTNWYPKLKPEGIMAGHDYWTPENDGLGHRMVKQGVDDAMAQSNNALNTKTLKMMGKDKNTLWWLDNANS